MKGRSHNTPFDEPALDTMDASSRGLPIDGSDARMSTDSRPPVIACTGLGGGILSGPTCRGLRRPHF